MQVRLARRQDEINRDTTLAWTIEALHRQKRLPALDTLLARRVRRQTSVEQRAALHVLSQQYNIPLRKGARKAKAAPLP